MLEIVKQIIEHYSKTWKKISILDLKIDEKSLMSEKISCFVTLYLNGEVRWSAWNIKELKDNAIEELIENTFEALTLDSRFWAIKMEDAKKLRIRIDKITERNLLKNRSIKSLDPTKVWVIVIKNSHDKMACILPNINTKMISWEDFWYVLKEKLWENNFDENQYFIYEIKTKIITNF